MFTDYVTIAYDIIHLTIDKILYKYSSKESLNLSMYVLCMRELCGYDFSNVASKDKRCIQSKENFFYLELDILQIQVIYNNAHKLNSYGEAHF